MEMLIVVAIMGVIALAAVPVAEISYVKSLENDLENSIELLRDAISQYKVDCITQLARNRFSIRNIPQHNLFPRNLKDLLTPTPVVITDLEGNYVTTYTPDASYLKSIPNDPFVGAPVWAMHCASNGKVATFPEQTIESLNGTGVYDISVAVSPNYDRKGFYKSLGGTNYIDW